MGFIKRGNGLGVWAYFSTLRKIRPKGFLIGRRMLAAQGSVLKKPTSHSP
jgi:hypothetical protein